MLSISSSFLFIIPHCRWKIPSLWIFLHSKPNSISISCSIFSSLNDNSVPNPKQTQFGYDPAEDLFGLEVDKKQRDLGAPKQRSWFGPNGQYIRELPCPSCRGRGYTPCTQCDIESSRADCSQCNGKGVKTCGQCLGERVIWKESIDERPWERARSKSRFKVKEDDDVDNLDIKLDVRRKSKRVYKPLSPEVSLKISRSLRSLNAKTGLFSKHMKILHQDPELRAQRVAAIKKAKGSPEARKKASESMKIFFRNPENRRKRSIVMKGVKFFCSNCGREGHRRHFCPEIVKEKTFHLQYQCGLCGEMGHNRRTCSRSKTTEPKRSTQIHHCKICGQSGHNRTTCPQRASIQIHYCQVCGQIGHNRRTCPQRAEVKPKYDSKQRLLSSGHRIYTCKFCKGIGHNIRTCSIRKEELHNSKHP